MKRLTIVAPLVLFFASIGVTLCDGADITAIQSGNWNSPNTWDKATVPGASDYVRIGSVGTASVTTSRDESALAVEVTNNSTLTLNGSLNGVNTLYISDGTVNANGRDISARYVNLFTGQSFVTNRGNYLVNDFTTYDQPFAVRTGDRINKLTLYETPATTGPTTLFHLTMYESSHLTIAAGATGLTMSSSDPGAFYVLRVPGADDSHITARIDGMTPGWAIRWANPAGGDHVGAFRDMVAQWQLDFEYANGGTYSIQDGGDGYTYIAANAPVSEPVGLIVAALSGLGAMWWVRRRWPENDAG